MQQIKLLSLILAGSLITAPILGLAAEKATVKEKTQEYMEETGQYVEDSVITGKVKAEFIGDSNLKSFDINVETIDGVVHLKGHVNSEKAKKHAAEVAKSVSGVKTVVNDLEVK